MKSLPFFVGIFMFFGLEAVFYWPKFFYIFLVFGVVLISLALKFVFKPGRKQDPLMNRGFWYFIISSLGFFLGTLCSVIFVKHGTLFYTIAALSSILLSGFFYTLNKHFAALRLNILNIKEKAEIQIEDNFSSKIFLFNLVTLFFGFIIFFRVPFWYLLPFVFLVAIFQTAQMFFVKSDYVSLYDKRILVIGLLVLQFFIILNYFPMTFLMSALFLAVFYGTIILFVSKSLHKCEGKWCRLYQVLIGVIILLVSLLTLRI